MEPERRKRESGNDANKYSENLISVSTKATELRNLKLRIQSKSVVIVQQSLAKQQQPYREHTLLKQQTKRANGGEVQSESALTTKGSLLDQHNRPAELVACQLQLRRAPKKKKSLPVILRKPKNTLILFSIDLVRVYPREHRYSS